MPEVMGMIHYQGYTAPTDFRDDVHLNSEREELRTGTLSKGDN
jgi:hypothetical protein